MSTREQHWTEAAEDEGEAELEGVEMGSSLAERWERHSPADKARARKLFGMSAADVARMVTRVREGDDGR